MCSTRANLTYHFIVSASVKCQRLPVQSSASNALSSLLLPPRSKLMASDVERIDARMANFFFCDDIIVEY